MVTNNVAATNSHVTRVLSTMPAGRISIDFLEEVGLAAKWEVDAKIIYFGADDTSDVAFLEITTIGKKLPPPITLVDMQVSVGEMVGVIGYPQEKIGGDKTNALDNKNKVYGTLPAWGKKYFSPGFVIQVSSFFCLAA